jgi:DNA helicase HerA-like ATPase
MPTALRISTEFSLPAEAVSETFAMLAKRGVGKTYTAAVLVEELLKAGLRVVVVDPVGVWWGLRAAADGTGEGLPVVILGGDHGDVPFEVSAGEPIADVVVDEELSVVLDLSHVRKGEQTRWLCRKCSYGDDFRRVDPVGGVIRRPAHRTVRRR